MLKKRVNARVLELVLLFFMAVFGLSAVFLAAGLLSSYLPIDPLFIVLEMLIVLIVIVLALCYLVVRVWEQKLVPYYDENLVHKK